MYAHPVASHGDSGVAATEHAKSPQPDGRGPVLLDRVCRCPSLPAMARTMLDELLNFLALQLGFNLLVLALSFALASLGEGPRNEE